MAGKIKFWNESLRAAQNHSVHSIVRKIAININGLRLLFGKNFKKHAGLSLVSALILFPVFGLSNAQAANSNGAFLVAKLSTTSPPGASNLCVKYRWACSVSGRPKMHSDTTLQLARSVNIRVNRQIRQIEDLAQYGRKEFWALPTARGGDCEDLVLLKKKYLIKKGVASETLLIATVLDRKRRSHAVLVLRTGRGDFVLDSLNDRIVHWTRTGYTFLKMQNPVSPGRWDAILAGGLI